MLLLYLNKLFGKISIKTTNIASKLNQRFSVMLFIFFVVIFLCSVSLGQQNNADIPIEQCITMVAKIERNGIGESKRRPSIDPSSCFDLDTGSCTLFNLQNQENYANNLKNPNDDNFADYKVSVNCKRYAKLAENLCPSSCALCCKTLDYSCTDVANCANITRAMCQTRAFYDALLRLCPQTCGFCSRPGAGNRCPDTIKECGILVGLGGCSHARIKELCQRSCHSLDCLNQTTALQPCRDERVNCGSRPDLCVGPYAAVYTNQCKFTCGLCHRG